MEKSYACLLELRKFVAPEFIFGSGARRLAGKYAVNFGLSKVLLVSDENLAAETAWVSDVERSLTAAGVEYVRFLQVSPNPRAAEVVAGAAVFARERCNGIVALGGGSVMDCAKGIGIVSTNGGSILDFEGVDKISHPMPLLICIPTTSGSASEVSQFAIILHEERKSKIAIVSKTVVPDLALLDPEVTVTMDPYLTACCGMDTLTHAIEAYVSNASSPITDLHALEAVRLICETLPAVIAAPYDLECRAPVLLASLEAGLAFSNAVLGATHAMAHSLGGFLDLAHGECNAILLGPVVQYNYSACPEKFQRIGRVFGLELADMEPDCAARQLCRAIELFRRGIGIGNSLKDLGIRQQDLPQLVGHAMQDACMATNPKGMTAKEMTAVYEQAF